MQIEMTEQTDDHCCVRALLEELGFEHLDAAGRAWWRHLVTDNRDLMHIIAQLLRELRDSGLALGDFYVLWSRAHGIRLAERDAGEREPANNDCESRAR